MLFRFQRTGTRGGRSRCMSLRNLGHHYPLPNLYLGKFAGKHSCMLDCLGDRCGVWGIVKTAQVPRDVKRLWPYPSGPGQRAELCYC